MRPLLNWQTDCLTSIAAHIAAGGTDYLASVTPSGGKTVLGLIQAKRMLEAGLIDTFIVLTPSVEIRRGWADTARDELGLRLSINLNRGEGFDGFAITYQALSNGTLEAFINLCSTKRVLVIADEIHHGGAGRSWGDAISTATDQATFRLGLTGTAYRSDDEEIPFLHYSHGQGVPDFIYTYGEALIDRIVAPLFFRWSNGSVRLSNNRTLSFDESVMLNDVQIARLLGAATAPNSKFSRELLAAAHSDLIAARASDPTAGGLVICQDIKAAKAAHRYLTGALAASAVLVTSDDSDAAHIALETFKTNRIQWLVSVAMVSEGVSISRLKVLAYLSNEKTEMAFVQATGRLTRLLPGREDQNVFVHLPKLAAFETFAGNIEWSRNHALQERGEEVDEPAAAPRRVCAECGGTSPAGVLACNHCGHVFPVRQPRRGAVVTNTDGFLDGMTLRGQHFTEAQLDQVITLFGPDDIEGLRQKGRAIWCAAHLLVMANSAKHANLTLDERLYRASEAMRDMPNRPVVPDDIRATPETVEAL